MSSLNAVQQSVPSGTPDRRQTPGLGVLGWLILCFAVMPVAMAVRGDGELYAWISLAMLAAGGLLVIAARRASRSP